MIVILSGAKDLSSVGSRTDLCSYETCFNVLIHQFIQDWAERDSDRSKRRSFALLRMTVFLQ
jgi:hypothetical protein